ncbi:acyl-CoA dehydrogenase [Gymnodinialimonas sp. 57CJ19]|uniref:acyl-CoA dehydrogenase n=1 Tax=Gymnodinialimonas sp. 57CJ19 TaxID=3138498 RepID=UPI0031342719
MNDEIQMMQDALSRYLAEAGGLRPAQDAHDGAADDAVWTALAKDLQLCGISLPEAAGGLNLGLAALTPLVRELGRVLSPVPFVSTVGVVAPVLCAAGEAGLPWLEKIAEGDLRATLGCWNADQVTATATDDGYRLTGDLGLVPDAPDADLIVVPATLDGQVVLFAMDGPDASDGDQSFDPTHPVGRVPLDGCTVPVTRLLPVDGGADALDTALDRAHVALAAEAAGAARGAFDLTLDYIQERRQFGRSIASFQAIKHRMAALFVQINTADAMIAGAAEGLDKEQAVAGQEARAAWAIARDVQSAMASEAIQLHGGVGATWEYAPHLFFKRARAQQDLAGTPSQNFATIGRALLAGDLSAVPQVADTPWRNEVRHWLDAHLTGDFDVLKDRGHAGDGDAEVELRKAWERELAGGGWVGIGLPESAGGRGISIADQVAFHEEYAARGGPGRMGHIGEGLMAPTLIEFGTDDQIARFLPGILKGETFWAQGYSEPTAGSDLGAVRTRARLCPDTGDWLVTGQKVWTSLAHVSDWVFVLARAEEGSVGRNGLVFLMMPLDQPEIDTRPIKQINGEAEFNEIFFNDARAKACDMLGGVGDGWKIAMALLGHERGISTLGQQMGFARELDTVIRLARARTDTDTLAEPLGRAWSGLRAMRHGAMRMLQAQSEGRAGPEMLGYKLEWSQWHRSLGDLAMDVIGPAAAAWSDDPDVRRLQHLYLFSRADTIYGGTSEIQLNIIAEHGLKMPREPRGTAP